LTTMSNNKRTAKLDIVVILLLAFLLCVGASARQPVVQPLLNKRMKQS